MKITHHLEESREYIQTKWTHQNRKMSTCNRLDLESPGSWPTMPKNFPGTGHGLWFDVRRRAMPAHKVKVCECYLVTCNPSNPYESDLVCVVRWGSKNKDRKGGSIWGFKSQVSLMLTSPYVETKSQFMSLEKSLEYDQFSLKLDLDYFIQKIFTWLVLRVGSRFFAWIDSQH